jgi:PPOX class probable FMN-dependent enzyme
MDVSPKGDTAGFVKVLDPKTFIIPDRIGNRRAYTFLNVLENSQLEMMIVVPRQKEVVRINGSVQVVLDEELLDIITVNGHRPDMSLLVRVQEAFFHCGKSLIRSGMWQPEKWGSIDGLPSYSQVLKDHGEMETPLDEIEARMAHNESDRLY